MGNADCWKRVDPKLLNHHPQCQGCGFKCYKNCEKRFDQNLSTFFTLPFLPQTFLLTPADSQTAKYVVHAEDLPHTILGITGGRTICSLFSLF